MFLPFQDEGARFLSRRRRALLGDGPRVGKTRQAIGAVDLVNANSILVVCPGIAREHWGREIRAISMFGLPVSVVLKPSDPIEPNGWTVVSLDGSRNAEIHAKVMRHRWDVLIVDEPQFLNNRNSQRTRQTLSATGFASKSDRIWFLTGTPLLNAPHELWVMLRTIGVYPSGFDLFQERYCEGYWHAEYGFVTTKAKNVPELQAMLAQVMLRRTFYQLFPDAPRPTWREAELDPTLVRDVDVAELAEVEGRPGLTRALDKLLRRVAAGESFDWDQAIPRSNFAMLRRVSSAAKTYPLAHWLRERLDSGEFDKVVVFAHHSRIIEILERELASYGAAAIRGVTKDRQARIDAFTTQLHRRVIICQDQIARTAIDLSAARHLVFAEMDPVPANNLQGAMRVQGHRQTRPVEIHTPYLRDSTDAPVSKIIARKARMEEAIFG